MRDLTIDINMDRDCERCGEVGVLPSGLCMKCVAEGMKEDIHEALIAEGGGMKSLLKVTEAKVSARIDGDGTLHKHISIKATMPYTEEANAFLGEHVEEALEAKIDARQLELGIGEE